MQNQVTHGQHLFKRIMPWRTSPMQGNMAFLPQYRERTNVHVPHGHQLYPGRYYAQTFAFTGLTPSEPKVIALGTESINRTMQDDFLVWALTGTVLGSDQGFRLSLYHNVRLPDGSSFIRPLMSRPVINSSILGTGARPFYLKQTYMIPAGDQIICEVKNLDTTRTETIWVALHGTYLNP